MQKIPSEMEVAPHYTLHTMLTLFTLLTLSTWLTLLTWFTLLTLSTWFTLLTLFTLFILFKLLHAASDAMQDRACPKMTQIDGQLFGYPHFGGSWTPCTSLYPSLCWNELRLVIKTKSQYQDHLDGQLTTTRPTFGLFLTSLGITVETSYVECWWHQNWVFARLKICLRGIFASVIVARSRLRATKCDPFAK